MKASEILEVAIGQIVQHAVFEFTQIVNNLISKGEIDPDTDIYDAYLKDFGITDTLMGDFYVGNTYDDTYWRQREEIVGLRFDREKKTVYAIPCTIDLDKQDPPRIQSLPTDDMAKAVDFLEQMWMNLIKTK